MSDKTKAFCLPKTEANLLFIFQLHQEGFYTVLKLNALALPIKIDFLFLKMSWRHTGSNHSLFLIII